MRNLMSASPPSEQHPFLAGAPPLQPRDENAPHCSPRVVLTVPAESNDPRARSGADDRPGFGDPMLDAVVALLHPVRHLARAIGHVGVQGAGVDARTLGDA